jgi:DNA-binding NarL/FixJ family response regulator
MKRRLLLAEDHALVGEGLRVLLAGDYEVMGPVRHGGDVLAAVGRERPDVVMLDLSLPGRNGLDLIPEIVVASPGTAVLVVTMHADRVLAERAFQLGAAGFVPKDSSADELRRAIEAVLAGGSYLSERVTRQPLPHPAAAGVPGVGGVPAREALAQLTPRQLVILRAIGRGLPSEAIAEELGLSVHTVHFHRRNLRRVLKVETEGGLEVYASRVVAEEGWEEG